MLLLSSPLPAIGLSWALCLRLDRTSVQTLAAIVRFCALTVLSNPARTFMEDSAPPLPCQQLGCHGPSPKELSEPVCKHWLQPSTHVCHECVDAETRYIVMYQRARDIDPKVPTTYIYIYMYIYIHTYIHIYIHIFIYLFMYLFQVSLQ